MAPDDPFPIPPHRKASPPTTGHPALPPPRSSRPRRLRNLAGSRRASYLRNSGAERAPGRL